MMVVSGIAITVFLGAWHGPFLPGRLVPGQAHGVPLLLHLAPRHLPAAPLRPAHGVRLEGSPAGVDTDLVVTATVVPCGSAMLIRPLFAMFAGIAIGCALGMIFHRNPVHCALMLVGVLLSVSGLFILLNASFLAALQVLVYAGAIMVLFLFVLMLLNLKGETPLLTRGAAKGFGILFAIVVFVELLWTVLSPQAEGGMAASPAVPTGFAAGRDRAGALHGLALSLRDHVDPAPDRVIGAVALPRGSSDDRPPSYRSSTTRSSPRSSSRSGWWGCSYGGAHSSSSCRSS